MEKMKKFKRGELAKNILLGLAVGGIVITICTFPGLVYVYDLFKPRNSTERYRIRRATYGLKKRKLIRIYTKNGKEVVELTEKGKKKVFEYRIEEMTLKIPKKWDKKWRMVIFDIPEKKKVARDTLNYKLKELNFYPFQKSIFITPYPCKDEIDFIVHYYNIEKFVSYIEANKISNEEKLRNYFGI